MSRTLSSPTTPYKYRTAAFPTPSRSDNASACVVNPFSFFVDFLGVAVHAFSLFGSSVQPPMGHGALLCLPDCRFSGPWLSGHRPLDRPGLSWLVHRRVRVDGPRGEHPALLGGARYVAQPGQGRRRGGEPLLCLGRAAPTSRSDKGCTQSREYSGNSDSGRPGALLILL